MADARCTTQRTELGCDLEKCQTALVSIALMSSVLRIVEDHLFLQFLVEHAPYFAAPLRRDGSSNVFILQNNDGHVRACSVAVLVVLNQIWKRWVWAHRRAWNRDIWVVGQWPIQIVWTRIREAICINSCGPVQERPRPYV